MQKKRILILGLITLLVFPIPAVVALYFLKDKSLFQIFELNDVFHPSTLLGFIWGIVFAGIGGFFFQKDQHNVDIKAQRQLLLSFNLSFFEKVFLAFCAGFGEELLFRAGIQEWLGVWLTSIVFIAVHGYLNPKKPQLAKYGLLLVPFIVTLGYGMQKFGLWFAIAAHMSYDLILFLSVKEEKEAVFFRKKQVKK